MMITFLLGSGVSLTAGMPCVDALTRQVVSGENLIRYAGTFALVEDSSTYLEKVEQDDPTLALVRRLADIASDFYGRFDEEREVNYEDVAYLAGQLDDCLMFEYENPALLPLVELLADEVGGVERLRELSSDAVELIAGVVWSILRRQTSEVGYLSCITDACREAPIGDGVGLITLNHDTVLEQALRQARIKFKDGFNTRVSAEIDAWDNEFDAYVQLYKPHGSVNWYRIYVDALKRQAVVRTDAPDPYHLKDDSGNRLDFPVKARGQFLAGTFNKILAYQSPVYFEQQIGADEALRRSSTLVVIGYGFGDKAINTRVIDWLDTYEGRLILVHPDPEAAIAGGRPALQRSVIAASRQGRFATVPSWVEDTTWEDIKADVV